MTDDAQDLLIDYLKARAVADEARSTWDHYLGANPLLPIPIPADADPHLSDVYDRLLKAQDREMAALGAIRPEATSPAPKE
ncbi:MAG: hypothetical protein M3O28_03665 [Actinomycetota bacterium]|nr:hypothetical protein [Actinomycetota bacterium]